MVGSMWAGISLTWSPTRRGGANSVLANTVLANTVLANTVLANTVLANTVLANTVCSSEQYQTLASSMDGLPWSMPRVLRPALATDHWAEVEMTVARTVRAWPKGRCRRP